MADKVVYLREIDAGTDNACMVVCSKDDIGAIEYIHPAIVSDMVCDGSITFEAHETIRGEDSDG